MVVHVEPGGVSVLPAGNTIYVVPVDISAMAAEILFWKMSIWVAVSPLPWFNIQVWSMKLSK